MLKKMMKMKIQEKMNKMTVCTKAKTDIEKLENEICEKLNPEQKSAVISELDEYTSVIAGAGTGKTTIISAKYVDMIAKLYNKGFKMPLNNILVITFTEKAAANMKVKIFKELKNNKIEYLGQENHISTIHSFCSKVLRKHAIEAGLTQYFNVGNDEDLNKIYDTIIQKIKANEFEKIDFIDEAAKKLGIDVSVLSHENLLKLQDVASVDDVIDSILNIIKQVKSLGLNAEEFLAKTTNAVPLYSETLKKLSFGEYSYEDYANNWSNLLFNDGFAVENAIDEDSFSKISANQYFFQKEKNGKKYDKRKCSEWEKGPYFDDLAKIDELEIFITKIIALVYETYQMQLLNTDMIGFDDMINLTLHILDNESIRKEYQQQFEHIVVDEFQDTSVAQMKLITKLMRDEYPNVTVVGDRKQSIYAFRYANMENVSDLTDFVKNKYGKVKEVNLKTNYRSTASVIEVVNDVTKNFLNKDNELLDTPHLPIENSVKMTYFAEKKAAEVRIDEAKQIAIEINNFKKENKDFKYGDFAVLVKKSSEADVVEKRLTACGIPSVKKGGTSFFNRPVIKNSRALLAFVCNLSDEYALVRLLNSAFSDRDVFLLKKSVDKALDVAKNEDFKKANFAERLYACKNSGKLSEMKDVNPDLITAIDNLYDSAEDVLKNIKNLSLLSIYLKMKDAFSPNSNKIDEILAERDIEIFERIISDYMQTEVYPSIKNFLDYLDTAKEDKQFVLPDVTKGRQNAVQIMTIHASKGLEFPYVFVFGLNDKTNPDKSCLKFELLNEKNGNFGLIINKYKTKETLKSVLYKKAYKNPKEYMEAVRLFYVAVSRAEKYLNIFCLPEVNKNMPAKYVANLNISDDKKIKIEDKDLKNLPKLKLKYSVVKTLRTKPEKAVESNFLPDLTLSFSKINTFEHCEKKFLLQYVYGYPQLLPENLTQSVQIGSAVHNLIHSSFINKRPFTKQELKEILSGEKSENEREIKYYEEFLKTSYADFDSDKNQSEAAFSCNFNDISFNGDIDLLITNSDGTKTIVDFKTNKDIEKSLPAYTKQLFIYQKAIEEKGFAVKDLIILNLQENSHREINMNDFAQKAGMELQNILQKIKDTILSGKAVKNQTKDCYLCGYKYLCQTQNDNNIDNLLENGLL